MEEIKHLKLIAGLCQAIFRQMWHFLTLFFFLCFVLAMGV